MDEEDIAVGDCLDACSQYYLMSEQSPYLPPSSEASQQTTQQPAQQPQQNSSSIVDSAYNSDHAPEEHEDAADPEAAAMEGEEPETEVKEKGKTITAALVELDLWKDFYKVGNEMIVTKPGRRLFPAAVVTVRGLNPSHTYTITLRVAPYDLCRYKFLNMQWSSVGESEINQNEHKQVYRHPSSPNSGSFWMKKPISFRAIKITHSPISKNGNILVHTMHKYVMEIIVSPTDKSGDTVIRLDETSFVAVSAYQNTNLTQLKIENNPFAKGFRDRGQGGEGGHQTRASSHQAHIAPYQPQVQGYTFGNGLPSIQFYRGEGYKPALFGQQMQSLQHLQTLPMGSFTLASGCTQPSPITPSFGPPMLGTGSAHLSPLTPMIVGSGCAQLPHLTPTLMGSGCLSQLTPTMANSSGYIQPPPITPPESLSPDPTLGMLSPPVISSSPSLGNSFLAQMYSNPGYSFYTQPHPGVSLPTGYNPPPTPPQ